MNEIFAGFRRILMLIIFWLVVISLIPTTLKVIQNNLPESWTGLSPIFLLVAALLGVAIWRRWPLWKMVWRPLEILFRIIIGTVVGLRYVILPSFGKTGWLAGFEKFSLVNRWNKGFVIDGRDGGLRLSAKDSFKSLVAVGSMGAGKSSKLVIPNMLQLDNCSMVVTDTSGELYQKTSGYLAEQGLEIKVLNLANPSRSLCYNPLANLNSYTDIYKAADLLVDSAGAGAERFWNDGAVQIVRILIQCLKNQGEPDQMTLGTVKSLLNRFDAHTAPAGQSLTDAFIVENTLNDEVTFEDYRGFTGGNDRTMASFLTTANTALAALGNPDLVRLTSGHDFDFAALKQRRTALYVIVNQQDMRHYAFLLNLFFTDLIKTLLNDLNGGPLPVYLMLDEFGHLKIPDFEIYATTARKYKVGMMILLQSLSQLESRYGRQDTATILNGIGTDIYLPGVGLDTAQQIQRRLGQSPNGKGALLTEADIIRLEDDQALLLHANKKPLRLKTGAYFQQRRLRKASEIPPKDLPHTP